MQSDGAYEYWRDSCAYESRLNVTHVDGHAYLGVGWDRSWLHLLSEHLHLSLSERIIVERRKGVRSGESDILDS